MKRNRIAAVAAVCVVGLLAWAPTAALGQVTLHNYFDAQVYDSLSEGKAGSTVVRETNTFLCDNCDPLVRGDHGVTDPNSPDFGHYSYQNWVPVSNADPLATFDISWPANQGPNAGQTPTAPGGGSNTGHDNRWAIRSSAAFGNTDGNGWGTVYEAGDNSGDTEVPPVLKTMVNVPEAHQGELRSVWALYWSDGSEWQIRAALEENCNGCESANLPIFVGGSGAPGRARGYAGNAYDLIPDTETLSSHSELGNPDYVYQVVAAAGSGVWGTDRGELVVSSGGPSLVSSGGRNLWAAYLGTVELGEELSVLVGHGPLNMVSQGSNNHRTWYDGIAIGEALELDPLLCIPEPASVILLGIAFAVFGLRRRTR